MNGLLKFSDYDVFAYLSTGLGAMAIWDFLFGTEMVLDGTWTVSTGLLTLASAYILGHLLAAPAKWLLEDNLIQKFFKPPVQVLMAKPQNQSDERKNSKDQVGNEAPGRFQRWLFRSYYAPLPTTLQEKINQRFQASGERWSEGLFEEAFLAATKEPMVVGRLETFQRLYGFCRNVAFLALSGALLILVVAMLEVWRSGLSQREVDRFWWAGLLCVAGCGMAHRYMKFYRLYGKEVLRALARG